MLRADSDPSAGGVDYAGSAFVRITEKWLAKKEKKPDMSIELPILRSVVRKRVSRDSIRAVTVPNRFT